MTKIKLLLPEDVVRKKYKKGEISFQECQERLQNIIDSFKNRLQQMENT